MQIESVVFELMSWREGFFSFEERARDEMPRDTRITVSTESLLMEGARRIDEWSRIADIVPNLDVVPELAPVGDDRGEDGGPMLDLLPHEWQVLTMIDGERDLRAIAAVARPRRVRDREDRVRAGDDRRHRRAIARHAPVARRATRARRLAIGDERRARVR